MSTKPSQAKDSSPEGKKKDKIPFIVAYFDSEICAKDPSGRTLADVLRYSDNQISMKHDFIQYLFPLPEESMINSRAPLITRSTYTAFRDRAELRSQLLQALDRMLSFYGFTHTSPSDDDSTPSRKYIPADDFKERSKYTWRRSMDHNHLRLTRIIRCLRVLSCGEEAKMLYEALLENDDGYVRSSSKMFWGRAAKRPLWLPPDEPDDDARGIKWLRQVCEEEAAEAAKAQAEGGKAEQEINQSIQESAGVDGTDDVEAKTKEMEAASIQPEAENDENKLANP